MRLIFKHDERMFERVRRDIWTYDDNLDLSFVTTNSDYERYI